MNTVGIGIYAEYGQRQPRSACVGWSGPSLPAYRINGINGYCRICQRTEKSLIRCADWSESLLFRYGKQALFPRCALKPVLLYYSRQSLSRRSRDSLKYFEISVPRHIRLQNWEKKIEQPHFTKEYYYNLTTEVRYIKILRKRGEISPSFPQYFVTYC